MTPLDAERARFLEFRPIALQLYEEFRAKRARPLGVEDSDAEIDRLTHALVRFEQAGFLTVFEECVTDGSLARYVSDERFIGTVRRAIQW